MLEINELLDYLVDTLKKCGLFLLDVDDETIEYNIFEEFDIGITSFFHNDSLLMLKNSNYINSDIYEKCQKLRKMVNEVQKTSDWSLEGVKNSGQWIIIMNLCESILHSLDSKKY